MTVETLIAHHPVLYHMAEAGTWPSIIEYGLLSTEALLDHFGSEAHERTTLLALRRPQMVIHRGISIRDQYAMDQEKFKKCLKHVIEPEQWYEFLNCKVFF